jgi:molybdenum cofactor synthesis domain-containing protein
VYARPSIAILSTGNEIVAPGQPLAPGQIYDINRFTIESVARRNGGVVASLSTAGDTLEDLRAAIDAGTRHDVLVFSGGSSVGERDLIIDAVRERGDVIFHGIAVKPGKPTLFARIGNTTVFGMPGYPTSCLSNAYILLLPFLRRMARLPAWEPKTMLLPLARRISSVAGRHQFYTVRVVNGAAEPAFKASGDITSMAHADGYIEVPADVEVVEGGTEVRVTLF